MIRIRRVEHGPRLELTPMIDVIFLLLTFFIYATVLMVRAELLPMELRRFEAARPARPQPATVISVDLEGTLFLDREAVELRELASRVLQRRAEEPTIAVYLAVADGPSEVDRAPILQDIWDALKDAGIELNLVGRPKDRPGSTPDESPESR